jgi:chromosome segregation ATPase
MKGPKQMGIEFPEHQASGAAEMLALIKLADDPVAAGTRLSQLVKASEAADAATERAKTELAKAEDAQRKTDLAVRDLTTRISTFQSWSDGTEKALREREAAVKAAEQAIARRAHDCGNREAAIAEREAEHKSLMARLRVHLDQFAGEAGNE